MKRIVLMTPLFLACLFAFSGCRQERRPDGMPPLHPCRITIIQDGQPLEGAIVTLHSTGQGTNWGPSGTTVADGIAIIYTQGQFRGVPEGNYKVTIRKEETISLATPEQLAAIEKAKAENPKWYDPPNIKQETWRLVEKQYTDAKETPLELIVSKGTNNVEFDLGKAVREKMDDNTE